jgi:hypothetical protein
LKKLHVVTAITNPQRYQSRYKLLRDFERKIYCSGAGLTIVEGAFGERPYEVTDASNPNHVQVRIQHELWHKENLLNIGISRLPECAEYVAWIDADITFLQPNWVEETVHALQHYEIVQPFSHAIDLGPERLGSPVVQAHSGFCFQHVTGAKRGPEYTNWHPGFAWAARRETLDKLEGLMDWTCLGSADHIMALAFIGAVSDSMAQGLHPNFYKLAKRFEYLCETQVKRNVGYVSGTILHHWHGKKADRKYQERWKILQDHQYDPLVDIMRDSRGVLRLTDNKPGLRDDLRRYFRERNEDSIDL